MGCGEHLLYRKRGMGSDNHRDIGRQQKAKIIQNLQAIKNHGASWTSKPELLQFMVGNQSVLVKRTRINKGDKPCHINDWRVVKFATCSIRWYTVYIII